MSETALHVGKRKELYEKVHPETRKGGTPGAGKGHGSKKRLDNRQNGGLPNETFSEETAKTTGKSKRSVERDATRANKVVVLAEIASLPPACRAADSLEVASTGPACRRGRCRVQVS